MEINEDNLILYGFKDVSNKQDKSWLELRIGDSYWYIVYMTFELTGRTEFYIEANGGRDDRGEFYLDHFTTIEQIDNLIKSMTL